MSGMPIIPPAPSVGSYTRLFSLSGGDLNSTADQAFRQMFAFNSYNIEKIVAVNASGAITLATGGIYTDVAKGGVALVAAAQSWAILTSSTKVANPTLTAAALNLLTATSLYLSLTTPMGSAGTCDIHIMGQAWS